MCTINMNDKNNTQKSLLIKTNEEFNETKNKAVIGFWYNNRSLNPDQKTWQSID